jgi:hypothetical protein
LVVKSLGLSLPQLLDLLQIDPSPCTPQNVLRCVSESTARTGNTNLLGSSVPYQPYPADRTRGINRRNYVSRSRAFHQSDVAPHASDLFITPVVGITTVAICLEPSIGREEWFGYFVAIVILSANV